MKASLSQRILRIMTRHEVAYLNKWNALQLLKAELSESGLASDEINHESFARTWRRHKTSLKNDA